VHHDRDGSLELALVHGLDAGPEDFGQHRGVDGP
jgi:hypothetical protein